MWQGLPKPVGKLNDISLVNHFDYLEKLGRLRNHQNHYHDQKAWRKNETGTQILEPILSLVESKEIVTLINSQPLSFNQSKKGISYQELSPQTTRKITDSLDAYLSPNNIKDIVVVHSS
jgi:hypothetical protein